MNTRLAVVLTLLLLWSGKLLPKVPADLRTPALIVHAALVAGWVGVLSGTSWAGVAMGAWKGSMLPGGVVAGAFAMVLAAGGYVFSQQGLGLAPPPEASLLRGSDVRLAAGVVLVLGASTLEEWLFRGALLGELGSLPAWAAALVSAAAFAAYHLSLFQLVPTVLLGLLLAALVFRSGSVWPAVVAHGVFNLLGVLLSAAGLAAGRDG